MLYKDYKIYSINFSGVKHTKLLKVSSLQNVKMGGLNLIDMNVKHCALKSSWIPNLLEQNSITEVLNMYLSSVGLIINLMLKMNFVPQNRII